MSNSFTGDQFWAELTEGQKIDAVVTGHATLKQMSEGLLDGSERLRAVCRECLAEIPSSFENLPDTVHETKALASEIAVPSAPGQPQPAGSSHEAPKQRCGLPAGFELHAPRFRRTVLLELNVYRLPDGQEFIVSFPKGTLASRRHLYALLTNEQYLKGVRGSVYVRTDGRIFNYAIDTGDTSRELFDTGYSMADLERTGHYAPTLKRRKKKQGQNSTHLKARSASAKS
jgi:hypothetical protein